MKRCPYCAEEIQDGAVMCRYCGKYLVGETLPPDPAERQPRLSPRTGLLALAAGLLLIVGALILVMLVGRGRPPAEADDASLPAGAGAPPTDQQVFVGCLQSTGEPDRFMLSVAWPGSGAAARRHGAAAEAADANRRAAPARPAGRRTGRRHRRASGS